MDRFKNIVVAAALGRLDAPMLKAAVKFAARNNAQLTVLDVIEPLPRWRRTVNVEGRLIDVQELMLRERTERLRHFVEITGDQLVVVVGTESGKPFAEMIRYVLKRGCDLVIIGEPEPLKRDPGGISVGVMQLLRKCPVPVWAMHPTRASTPLRRPDRTEPLMTLGLALLVFLLAATVVVRAGTALAAAGDQLAEKTGFGRLFVGTILLAFAGRRGPGSSGDLPVEAVAHTRNRIEVASSAEKATNAPLLCRRSA